MTYHAKVRLNERYRASTQSFRIAYKKAIADKNYLIGNDLAHNRADRAIMLFSHDRRFLSKIVLSKKDGAILTILPVLKQDFDLARYEKIID